MTPLHSISLLFNTGITKDQNHDMTWLVTNIITLSIECHWYLFKDQGALEN